MGLTNDDHQNSLLANFKRNSPKLFERYLTLPEYTPSMVVRCPIHNHDTPIPEDDIKGCGSTSVMYSGDVYDCMVCGIFFSDYAANPPHRRREDEDDNLVEWNI